MSGIASYTLRVARTARVEIAGDPRSASELWILLHGYAQTAAEFLAQCSPLAREQRVLVAPEALSRFYRRGSSGPIGASWMTREARDAEIADYVEYLDGVARWCERELGVASRPAVLGFSQGAATAWRWAMLGETRPSRILSVGGGIPPDLELSTRRAQLEGLCVDIVRGRDDAYHTAEWLERDRARLAELRISCDVHEFDGAHVLDAATLAAL